MKNGGAKEGGEEKRDEESEEEQLKVQPFPNGVRDLNHWTPKRI